MHADIEINGHRGTIRLDGHDVSKGIRGFRLTGEAGQLARLELDVLIVETTRAAADVSAYLNPEAVELLKRLGWTPPETP
ncbi:hypothetical protein OHA01_26300 [Micromonospora zamorensis]|uniref:hypothetical protein n=1 Tax=Micromonospora zamorensis TaxID=709883 RepID=UPI0038655F48|nr:hypothetical protein OHA01_26300 [Micromonospora zamorensis]